MSSPVSQVPSFYSFGGTTRLNGTEFASGLDTQKLILALTSKTSAKIDRQKQLEQKAAWKQEMFHDIEDMLQKFSDNYFSYSSSSATNIMRKSFFDSENLISSANDIVTATGDMGDAGNVVINSISQLATRASLNTKEQVSDESIDSLSPIGTTISSSSYLSLKVGDSAYHISLGSGVDTADSSGAARSDTDVAKDIAANLQKQVDSFDKLKGNVTITADGGKISVSGATITGASQNFISGLSLTKGGTDDAPVYTAGGSIDSTALSNLGTQLAGVTLTFQLDGLQKDITFDQSDISKYSDPGSLQSYLQGKLNNAFGSGKITVSLNSGKLSLSVSDHTSVLQLSSSSDGGTLGKDGVLHMKDGETNRLELTKTLGELSQNPELSGTLSSTATKTVTNQDGSTRTVHVYEISVNGRTFSFDDDTELNTVINTINNDQDADVNITYSQTLDQFRIESKDTGSQENMQINDVADNGNLAATLFGNGSVVKGQDLQMSVTIGGKSQDITRSTNSFTLDGLKLNIEKTYSNSDPTKAISFTASSNTDDVYKDVSGFIDAYNQLMDKINTYVTQAPYGLSNIAGKTQSYEPLTDDQKQGMSDTEITKWNNKAKQGLLFCDAQLTSLQNDLRSATESPVDSAGISLSDIGITLSDDYMSGGKLEITDANKLKDALATKTDKIAQLFTSVDDSSDAGSGIAQRVRKVITNNIGAYGNSGILVDVAGSSTMAGADSSELSNEIAGYENQIKDLQSQLSTQQNNLQAQFTRMEQVIYQLSNQSNYLASISS